MMLAQFPALASFTEVHKYTDTATGKTKVFIPSTPKDTVVSVMTEGAPKDRFLTLNNCGWGKFSDSTTSPIQAVKNSSGTDLTVAAGAAPTCTAGTTPGTYVDSNTTATVGDVIKAGTVYWVKGGTAIGSYQIKTVALQTAKAKGGNCGFAAISTSDSRPLTAFKIGATDYTLAALPAAAAPMYCKKTGTSYTNYLPASGFGS